MVGVKEHVNIQTDELVSVPPSSPTKVLDGAGKMSVEKAGCGPLQQSEVTDMKSADLHDNLTAIGLLAAEALRGCGWNGVDRDSIQVEDLSGAGGSKTYKISVTGGGVTPAAVAFHSRDGSLSKKSEERTAAAALLFGKHGLSPRRLAQGVDWFIESWKGYGQPTWATADDMRALGKEVAKVHKLPIEWYAPFRAQLKEEFPLYTKVPDNSHIWWYSCRTADLVTPHGTDPEWLAEYVQPMFTPQTKVGSRIVTCHGDLHAGNMISLVEGRSMQATQFVDLEFSHVSAACYDLAYVMFHYEDMPLKDKDIKRDDVGIMRQTFLKSYLESMGQPCAKQDVDALFMDATLAACGHHFGLFKPWSCDVDALKRFRQHAAELLASGAEQKIFRARGPEGWLAMRGYEVSASCLDKNLLKAFKFLDRIVTSSSV